MGFKVDSRFLQKGSQEVKFRRRICILRLGYGIFRLRVQDLTLNPNTGVGLDLSGFGIQRLTLNTGTGVLLDLGGNASGEQGPQRIHGSSMFTMSRTESMFDIGYPDQDTF